MAHTKGIGASAMTNFLATLGTFLAIIQEVMGNFVLAINFGKAVVGVHHALAGNVAAGHALLLVLLVTPLLLVIPLLLVLLVTPLLLVLLVTRRCCWCCWTRSCRCRWLYYSVIRIRGTTFDVCI
ncbi:hypothetical protein RHMOL_Rhmol02G0049600 [Rhododendron molle]|uniref:Uncharacterized protein n=1 Tax=Rhododendron molle TaxID=49168 RepID=A0ACC0PLF4_RHOML|nr:hypothetical protein RHMOL_Rhmol02G0049600 [Rhododendron molle]